MDFRKALLDAAQQPLVPVDLQVRMQAALHEHASSTQFDRLAYLLVNGVEVEDIAFGCELAFELTIEGEKRAVLSAEVRVINIAIDDVGDYTFRMQLAPHGIGFHAEANEIVRAKEVECLRFSQGHKLRTF